MPSRPRNKYLERYATPEVSLADHLEGNWSHVLVVPARAEAPDFVDRYRVAAASASGPVLIIVVINGSEDADADTHRNNARLLDALDARYPDAVRVRDDAARLHRDDDLSLLWIDRAGPGLRLAAKQGVGLARRIGCDLALSLIHRNQIEHAWLHTTDADATLPADYFHRAAMGDEDTAVALVHPFRHVTGDLTETEAEALTRYELSLRYYVVGLALAGSPYAYHAIGSTMSVRADTYAAVRGMPQRQAGEDFYLLNKLAKHGSILVPSGAPLTLDGRMSDRVPFGTGPATRRIATELAAGRDMYLYHPRIFHLLGAWMEGIARFAAARDWSVVDRSLRSVDHGAILHSCLDRIGAPAALRDAVHRCRTETALLRRCHEWMDAFRTLKLVHALRDAGLPMTPWRAAVSAAPFSVDGDGHAQHVCDALARLEPSRAGLFRQ